MIIEKKLIKVDGLKDPFERVISFSTKTHRFKVTFPVDIPKGNLIQTDYLTAESYDEAVKGFNSKIELFEGMRMKYKEVILYKYEENYDSQNGAGIGFTFMWGVFKKLFKGIDHEYDSSREYKYFFIRGGENKKGKHLCEVWNRLDYRERKEWKEVDCTPEAEAFFNTCSDRLQQFHDKLMEFFVHNELKSFDKQLTL